MKLINDRRRMRGQGGFTLIELLVVIAILGILASVTVFAVNGLTDNSQESACQIDKRTIQTAVQAYKADQGTYPADLHVLVVGPPQLLDDDPEAGRWDYVAASGEVSAASGGDCVGLA